MTYGDSIFDHFFHITPNFLSFFNGTIFFKYKVDCKLADNQCASMGCDAW